MARKPTPSSVTSTPCRCPWLRNAAAEPEVPVKFDEAVGEYHVEHRGGGYSVIRHCPWCGGVVPPSKRASLFATITSAELRRLARLTAKLETVEDALAKLGEPDHREPKGLTIHRPARGRRSPRVETFPTMTFSKLSTVADVTLADYGPRGIGFSFSPKYVGKPKGSRPRHLRRR
jgi:hypothetical protein